MAMAEVFIPDRDEDPFPRAPPPSPEFQPKGIENIFEIPLSKFDMSEPRLSPIADNSFDDALDQTYRKGSPTLSSPPSLYASPNSLQENGLHEHSPEATDIPQPLLPEAPGYTIPIPSHHRSPETVGSYSQSPPLLTNLSLHQSSPQKVTPFSNGINKTQNCTSLRSRSLNVAPDDSVRFLSRSLESQPFHPRRVDATPTSNHKVAGYQRLDVSYEAEEPEQRRRKISLKRKNEELGLDFNQNLEFSWECSYSSSSGESTDGGWVIVDSSGYPLGKKACCQGTENNVLSRTRTPRVQQHHSPVLRTGLVSSTSSGNSQSDSSLSTSSMTTTASPSFIQRPASAEFHVGNYPVHTPSSFVTPQFAGITPSTNVSPSHSHVPTCYTHVPTSCTHVPTSYTHVPASYTHVPTSYTHVPTSYTHVPTSYTHVPTSYTHVPTSYSHVPASYTHVPTSYTHIPTFQPMSVPHHSIPSSHPLPFGPTLSIDSVQMMDCVDYRMDSIDSMDCGPCDQMDSIEMESLSSALYHSNVEQTQIPHTQPLDMGLPLQSPTEIGRSHSSGGSYTPDPQVLARHDFMRNFFSSYHEQHSETFPNTSSTSVARFAKSL